MLSNNQERELEKVNAFYLQKEAEVRNTDWISQLLAKLRSSKYA